jgi:2-polyprenyl-3-methyl-5-hydroxy-6-metoxy-1,4-benzoquinol methylase
MTTKQQAEALKFFKTHADDWGQKAKTLSQIKFNVIQARNHYALSVIKEREETETVLDVGCGTGDLVCDIARIGISALGVDFADDMISLAVTAAEKENLEKARFVTASIFDLEFVANSYDVIVANGFIEYISQEELVHFISLVNATLSPGGSIILGSRNRLFNLFSLNAYTKMELESDHTSKLIEEAIILSRAETLENLPDFKPAPWQEPETRHAQTNIEVTTRFQYTPLQLVELLRNENLLVREICPIHIHGVPPSFKSDFPQVHTSVANLLQSYARHRLDLVPTASTLMIHAQKESG